MINFVLFLVAMLVALRIVSPVLRIAMRWVARLLGFAFLIAVALLLMVAFVTHGALI